MSQKMPSGLSVIIPVYNSAKTLQLVVDDVIRVVRATGRQFEILLVNDGSSDRSWEIVQSIASQNRNVCGINLQKNYGQHNALLCGIRMARFDVLITLDDDMQHPSREIPKLLEKLDEGNCDVVYGIPEKLPHSFVRNLISRMVKGIIILATGLKRLRYQSPFRVFRTELRNAFVNFSSREILLDALLAWGTSRFDAVRVKYEPRKEGKSNYTPKKLFNMTVLFLTSYSTAPLRIAGLTGFAMTIFGLLILAYILLAYLYSGSIPGWLVVICVIAILVGTQMLVLGIFAEYISRIYNRILDQPPYIIRETTPQRET